MPLILNGTTGVSGIDGSAGTPSYQGGDTNTGIFYPAADTIAFAEGGAEVMRIDSSGNVGINNSSPTYRLDTMGSLALGTSARSGISLNTSAGIYIYQTNTGGSFEIASAVGGSAGPGGSSVVARLGFYSDGITQMVDSAAPMRFGTSGVERMRISSSGQVGIGTTSPAVPLDVVSDGSAEVLRLRGRASDNIGTVRFTSNDGATAYGAIQGRSTYIEYATSQAIPLIFTTNSAERMRIHSSGGVSINNTTDPGAGNLSVTGAVSATTAFRETNGSSTIANGATFNITIPSPRRPQLLTLYSTYNLYQTSLVLVVGDASSNVATTFIVNGGGLAVAGTATNIVRITNNLGGTAGIYWSLLPLGVGV